MMKVPPVSPFLSLFKRIVNSGVYADMPFDEIKRTRLINICILCCMPISSTFVFVNLVQHKYILSIICLLVFLGGVAIVYINYKRKFYLGRLVLILGSTIIFTLSALLYRNGAEHFLLLNIVLAIILFHNKWFTYGFSIVNAILYLFITLTISRHIEIEVISDARVLLNIGMMLLLFIVALNYFREEHVNYQQQIEEKHKELYVQQLQLMDQKDVLEKNNRSLEVLNQSKEKLFSIIAHDMTSPLGNLRGSLDLLQHKLMTEEEFSNVSAVLVQQVQSLEESLSNLLQWSRSQLNGISVQSSIFLMMPLIIEQIRLFQPVLDKKGLRIINDIDNNITCQADANHFKIIFRNLLTNAIKFSPPGSAIHLYNVIKPGLILISVADSGTGIPEEQLQLLSAGRINISTRGTRNEKGTGVGLLLCKEFIEKNEGQFIIQPNTPSGSIFTVALPHVNTSTQH